MKNLLETVIQDIVYENLGNWQYSRIATFSQEKSLFEYQVQALKNIIKVLYLYYSPENGKKELYNLYKKHGLESNAFSIPQYLTKKDKETNKINPRFKFFLHYFQVLGNEWEQKYISGENFLNRACFWMATGSGKSIVLIKTIEILDYLMNQNLIPKKEIMLLLPREDLINQFKKQIEEFNKSNEKHIELVNLKEYESDKYSFRFSSTIKVYYYRSDLLRDERKEAILDYKTYYNYGNWYVFLDEAHRGEKENSLFQDYVSVLSKNGFLFNFSATFTDEIDYVTTCYNFNLEKFINAGYGKNIYLSPSYFSFKDTKDDLNEREKQKQVLKSLLVLTLIKKSKKNGYYHNPLLVTLVNSVNTDDSDLLLFFKKLEEIATGKVDETIFSEAKKELTQDFSNHTSFIFGEEKLDFDKTLLDNIEIKDVLNQVFNAKDYGKIEILEGEKGKEIALKLQNSDRIFALIKIGDTKTFQKEKLGSNYVVLHSFDEKKYFENINNNDDINLLLGSRSFYEGWDSNRPNVVNLINIGTKDAKKFVLQAIGRGIRIEPKKGERKRLPQNDENKNTLLETLFVFATDKNAIKAIVETVENEKIKEETVLSLFENEKKPFDLLIPFYKEEKSKENFSKFNISFSSLGNFKKFIHSFDKHTLSIKYGIKIEKLNILYDKIENNSFFQIKEENNYFDMEMLLYKMIHHIGLKNKVVGGVKELQDEIIHFKHIKVLNFSDEEIKSLNNKIQKVKNFEKIDTKNLEQKVKSGEISFEEALKLGNSTQEENFKDVKIKKIAKHYYVPLMYTENEKINYIKHIINIKSEVDFIKKLENYLQNNTFDGEWMFSKIDQSLDKFYIPYFSKIKNEYLKFFPDFVFWIKKDKDYKIVFVDPKTTTYTDYENKIDDFEKLFFDENGNKKKFAYSDFTITFDLKLVTDDRDKVSEKYKNYWMDDIGSIFQEF